MSERPSSRRRLRATAFASVTLWLCAACDGGASVDANRSGQEPASAAAPLADGVALEVGGVALLVSQIEALADTLALVHPEQTRPALLRRVLVDVCLPRIALARVHAQERERALAAAELAVVELRAGRSQNLPATLVSPFAELDIPLQTALRGAPAGAIVGPVESALGTFSVALVKTPFDAERGPLQEVVVDGWTFSYLDPSDEAGLNAGHAALDGLGVRFASDAWRDLVPLTVQTRLGLKQ